jgi:cation transporter-like permease
VAGWRDGSANGSKPDLSQSRFFCNNARKGALVCAILAFVALVIGAGFAEISSNGAPTSLETAVVRWIIVGALVAGVTLYVIGGRMPRADRHGGR